MRCLGGLGDLGVAFPARSHHAEQMPGHSAVSLAGGLCIVRFLRIQYGVRNKICQQEKSLGARGMLVNVGVNRLLRSRHGDHMVPLHHGYDPWGNERVADLAHEVRGRAAPQLAIVRRVAPRSGGDFCLI